MTATLPDLQTFLGQLQTNRLTFFPLRHHSPACAWHLQQLICQTHPAAILIEGPSDANSDIPNLLHPDAQAPFALYTTYNDFSGHLTDLETDLENGAPSGEPSRFAAYYPFCDYSPELVALRAGAEINAELQFIDLTYPEQVIAARPQISQGKAVRLKALQSDRHLNRSAYLNALAAKANCRDFNELWDHLFESQIQRISTPDFIRAVATYCYFARQDAPAELLEADGTHTREAAMARAIAKTLKRLKKEGIDGNVLVVTGGLHTVALPGLVAKPPKAPQKLKFKKDSAQRFLVRYGFEQLDTLNGYASGMPSPAYYQTLWENLQADASCTGRFSSPSDDASPETSSKPAPPDSSAPAISSASAPDETSTLGKGRFSSSSDDASPETLSKPAPTVSPAGLTSPAHQTAAQLLIQIRAQSQKRKTLTSLSISDEIAALEQATRLAQLRQHPGPSRQDLIDATKSCFVKGDMDAEGALMMTAVDKALRGDRVGNLPVHIGLPPIVEDFRRQAKLLRLKLNSTEAKSLSLDLYRKQKHRQASRLFHSLKFLKVPFAKRRGGPDFVKGKKLDRLIEDWEYEWQPKTESYLIERSRHGSTVAEATLEKLKLAILELAVTGEGQSALVAVRLLIDACRMGLHGHTTELLRRIDSQVNQDSDFLSLAEALNQLTLLWQSREPLEAHRLPQIPELSAIAYRRLCYLLSSLAQFPTDRVSPLLNALASLWERINREPNPEQLSQLAESEETQLDSDLFIDGLLSLLEIQGGNAIVQGAAAGILYNAGCLEGESLVAMASGYIAGAIASPSESVGFLRGLLSLSREVAWQLPQLLESLDHQLKQWSDDDFLQVLPELRLAFADLLPRETDRVSQLVQGLYEPQPESSLLLLTPEAITLTPQLNQRITAALQSEGLGHWLTAPTDNASVSSL